MTRSPIFSIDFTNWKNPANLNCHMSIKKVSVAFGLHWAQKTKPCFVTLRTFFSSTAGQGVENTKWVAVIFSAHFAWLFLNRHMMVWFSWIISICEIYGEYRTAGHLVFWKPWKAVELKKVVSVKPWFCLLSPAWTKRYSWDLQSISGLLEFS